MSMKCLRRKVIRCCVLLILCAVMLGSSSMNGVFAKQQREESILERNTVWVYKTENGKNYKRLYDENVQKWLTDWILVS